MQSLIWRSWLSLSMSGDEMFISCSTMSVGRWRLQHDFFHQFPRSSRTAIKPMLRLWFLRTWPPDSLCDLPEEQESGLPNIFTLINAPRGEHKVPKICRIRDRARSGSSSRGIRFACEQDCSPHLWNLQGTQSVCCT
jgi:hypothetical protein